MLMIQAFPQKNVKPTSKQLNFLPRPASLYEQNRQWPPHGIDFANPTETGSKTPLQSQASILRSLQHRQTSASFERN
jgi:hypothetical protein